MKQILKDIFKILSRRGEPKTLATYSGGRLHQHFGYCVPDRFALCGQFLYSIRCAAITKIFFDMSCFNEHPVLLISLFLVLFTIKNILGFLISKAQYNYVYGVASRISRDNLLQYLNGPYTDYIHVDSSVMNRRISQQPIEFCHYVLNGFQQIFSQTVLILITLIAVVIFNPLLLPLLMLILVPPVF